LEGGEASGNVLALALWASWLGRFMLGKRLGLLKVLSTLITSIFVNRHAVVPSQPIRCGLPRTTHGHYSTIGVVREQPDGAC
jgi:hypothetical protein